MHRHRVYLVPVRCYEESSQRQVLHNDGFPHLLIPAGSVGTCSWPPRLSLFSLRYRRACTAGSIPDLCNTASIAVKVFAGRGSCLQFGGGGRGKQHL